MDKINKRVPTWTVSNGLKDPSEVGRVHQSYTGRLRVAYVSSQMLQDHLYRNAATESRELSGRF